MAQPPPPTLETPVPAAAAPAVAPAGKKKKKRRGLRGRRGGAPAPAAAAAAAAAAAGADPTAAAPARRKKKRVRRKKAKKAALVAADPAPVRLDVRELEPLDYRAQHGDAHEAALLAPCVACGTKAGAGAAGLKVPRQCSVCSGVVCSSSRCGVDTVLDPNLNLTTGNTRRTLCTLCFPGFKRKVLYKAKQEPVYEEDARLAVRLAEESLRAEPRAPDAAAAQCSWCHLVFTAWRLRVACERCHAVVCGAAPCTRLLFCPQLSAFTHVAVCAQCVARGGVDTRDPRRELEGRFSNV